MAGYRQTTTIPGSRQGQRVSDPWLVQNDFDSPALPQKGLKQRQLNECDPRCKDISNASILEVVQKSGPDQDVLLCGSDLWQVQSDGVTRRQGGYKPCVVLNSAVRSTVSRYLT